MGNLGYQIGESFGSGLSEGLQMLAENKFKALEQRQKGLEGASSAVSKFSKESGRDYADTEEYDRILAYTQELINRGTPPNEAAQKAWQWNESDENPINKVEEKQGFFSSLFDLSSGSEDKGKGESAGEQDTPGGFMGSLKKYSPDKAIYSAATDAAKGIGSYAKNLFTPQETPESIALEERANEKSKTAKSLDEFTQGELSSLRPDAIKNLPEEVQKDYWEIAPFLVKRSEGISKTAVFPFFGKPLEKRLREQIDPDLPPPPPMADLSRSILELQAMIMASGGTAPMEALKLGGLFGGGALASELIRTGGTDKPIDKGEIGKETAIGLAFPVVGKILQYLGKSTLKIINKIAKTKGVKPGVVLKEAEEAGVSISKLQKGDAAEKVKLGNFLEKESETLGATTSKLQKGLDPERVKAVDFLEKKEAATVKKARSLKIERAETAKEATTRFAKESKELSKSSFDKYLEKKPETKAMAVRREALEPKKIANDKELISLKAKRKYLVESGARKENQAAIDLAEKERYGIGFEAKYGHKPTMSSIMEKVKKAEKNLVNDIIDPTAKSQQSLKKFNKTTNTFVDRAEKEMVYGKNRKELPDKFVEDYFQTLNGKYLKMYENLETKVQKEILNPNSLISKSGKGDEILSQLKSKIGSSKTRLDVQMRKRKSLEALKGGKGVFHRKWIDDIKGEQKLFNKDMLRISNKITQAERKVTPTALKRISKSKDIAALKNEKEVLKEGAKIAQLPRVRSAEEAGRKAYNLDKDGFIKGAEKFGYTEAEGKSIGSAIAEVKSVPKKAPWSVKSREFKKTIRKVLLDHPVRQMVAGASIGIIDNMMEELFGFGLSGKPRQFIYGTLGYARLSGFSTLPGIGALYITNELLDFARVNYHRSQLKKKRGSERKKYYSKVKKKSFSKSQLKVIKS